MKLHKMEPPRSRIRLPVLLLGLSLATTRGLVATPEFLFIGDLPGGSDYSVAYGVSADGTYVVGGSSSTLSGPVSPITYPATEAFVWDRNRGMVALGRLSGSSVVSVANDVTADGNVVVGNSTHHISQFFAPVYLPFRWTRGGSMERLGPTMVGNNPVFGTAAAITADGSTVAGSLSIDLFPWSAFTWNLGSPLSVVTLIELPNSYTGAAAIGAIGTNEWVVGTVAPFFGDGAKGIFRWPGENPLELLGEMDDLPTAPTGISANGRTIVGYVTVQQDGFTRFRPFVWREGRDPAFKTLQEPGPIGTDYSAVGVSADGRVILDRAGGLYLDDKGPFDLRQILAEIGVIDLLSLQPSAFRAHAISDNGLVCVGYAVLNGITKAWRVRLTDCDGNSLPDELERFVFVNDTSKLITQGSERFANSRESGETLGYGDMIKHYGRPWKPGTGQTPIEDLSQPAEHLRAALRIEGCIDAEVVNTADAANRALTGVVFPTVQELHAFEMLLGNEAFADALDPTIGLDGVPAGGDINNQYAFKGASGIGDLLDEELVLLRGRELPGNPADWLSTESEGIYYPEFTGLDGSFAEMAVYNRLPPNATGRNGTAYRSNYAVIDNYEAAVKFPQGHGDAYGHYLSALKAGLDFLKDGPPNWPAQFLSAITHIVTSEDAGLETVRQLAEAASARSQSAAQVVELTYRRDYREDQQDPRTLELFTDADPDRAWSMGEWARRGAEGTYLDWAVVSHWAPTDEARIVHRANLPELAELAGAVSGFQGRLDTAGGGLDPLGLVQNVVPFGLDVSGLEANPRRSHYDQIRDAAVGALDNARKAFQGANEVNQRLRDSDQKFEDLTDRIEDVKADHDQQMIEIFGLPSPDDPQDNDDDPTTGDFEESQSRPDLTRFLLTDDDLAALGFRPRQAPGQIQIGLSELRVAGLRIEQADLAIVDLAAQVRDQIQRIQSIIEVQIERVEIITKARDDQIALTKRLEQLEERKKDALMLGRMFHDLAKTIGPQFFFEVPGQFLTAMAEGSFKDLENTFDIEAERTRVQAWKEIGFQGLEDKLLIEAERIQLKALLRRSPQLLLDRAVAVQVASQALGRMQQSVARGKLVLKEKKRLTARTEGQQLEERWKDMSFRIFRNAALKNYRAFFDIAARYVVLATRAYAYEFETRADGEAALAGIYRERRLGSATGFDGGLQSVITRLDAAAVVHNRNRPIRLLNELEFTFRENMLGIGNDDFPNDGRRFRSWLESNIVDRIEDIAEVRELATISIDRDFGPAIVIPFASEVNGFNFFGHGPEPPFNANNFQMSSNPKMLKFAVRLNGVSAQLGTDPNSGAVTVYFLPVGDSILRESTNKPFIEDELILPWAVVDQFLPVPSVASNTDVTQRSYNPWRSTAQAGGNFLNEIKRQKDSVAQIGFGQTGDKVIYNTQLAGRSAWNTRWLLIIPGHRFASSSDPAVIRGKLLELIYGSPPDPSNTNGMENITLFIQAYTH